MTTWTRLGRFVTRMDGRCAFCGYPLVPYSSEFAPTIGGVPIAAPCCSQNCAERGWDATRGPLALS